MNQGNYDGIFHGPAQRRAGTEKYKKSFFSSIKSTVYMLITVAAVAVLIAVLVMPVLQIYGNLMSPSLTEGNIVLSVKGSKFKTGDVIAFYYNNKILVKRVYRTAGEWVNIDQTEQYICQFRMVDEPYISEKAFGECDSETPFNRCRNHASLRWRSQKRVHRLAKYINRLCCRRTDRRESSVPCLAVTAIGPVNPTVKYQTYSSVIRSFGQTMGKTPYGSLNQQKTRRLKPLGGF